MIGPYMLLQIVLSIIIIIHFASCNYTFFLHMSIPFNLSKINLSLLWKDSDKKCAEKVLYLNENVRDQDAYLEFHDQTPMLVVLVIFK